MLNKGPQSRGLALIP